MSVPDTKTAPKTKAKTAKVKAPTTKPKVESRDSPINGSSNSKNGAASPGNGVKPPILSPDPGDVEKFLVENEDAFSGGEFSNVVGTVALGTPSNTEFFRVRANEDYWRNTHIVEHNGVKYLVSPDMLDPFGGLAKVVMLVTCINMAGALKIWPLKLGENSWNQSAQTAANRALTSWVRIQSNQLMKQYDIVENPHIADPVWPDKPFTELVSMAFGDNKIDNTNHEVFKHLMGEK